MIILDLISHLKGMATEKESVPSFSSERNFSFTNIVSVESNSVFDVILNNSPDNVEDSATIEGKEEQIKNIEIVESNGHLTIKCKSGNYNLVTIRINSRNLKNIKTSGTGNLSGTYVGDRLEITNVGTADIVLTGEVNKLEITNKGTGDIRLENMEAVDVNFQNVGTGDIYVWGTQTVRGASSGCGDVRYYGSKSHLIKSTGLGEVIHCGEKKPLPKKMVNEEKNDSNLKKAYKYRL